MSYNFCRKRQTLGMTPAQATRLIDHPWKLEDVIALLGKNETIPLLAFQTPQEEASPRTTSKAFTRATPVLTSR